jgi:tRNA G10  N-methylase Trm11
VNPYYYNGNITLYQAKAEELVPHFLDGMFSVLVLDPPYTIRLNNLDEIVARFRVKFRARAEGGAFRVIVPALINMPTVAEFGHPHARPVERMKEELARTTGWILDPYAGVGSTLIAAKQLGREAVGIEMDEKRCAVIVERLMAA